MRTVGAWITKSALSSPRATAEDLARAGLSMANIMLNDYAGARAPRSFETHDPEKVRELAAELRRAGLEVELTTWVMRHEGFIAGMAEQLPELVESTGARRLWLDAEEPWTRSLDPLSDEVAAGLIGEALPGIELGLSAISAAREALLDSLAELCPWWSPQAYATTRPRSMRPDTAVQRSLARWRERFGEPRSGWMMGLAAYSQPIPASSSMQPCLDHTEDSGVDEVCYWSHRPILRRPDVAAVIAGIEEPDELPREDGGSIQPWIDIEALPSGVEDLTVGQIQGLLAAHVVADPSLISPGPVDLLPGPRTQGSLKSFQASRGLDPGACDGGTWWHLLRAA